MAFKLVVFVACVAAASAGVIPAGPVAYSGYAAPAAYAHAAPVAYSGYAAPAAYAHAPVAYAAHAAPVVKSFAAPVAYAHAPVVAKAVAPVSVDTDYDPNPSYSYSYDIQDALTGDSKGQQETRQGDVVQGSYSVVDPDGTRRTVEYTADPVNGFNAVVHKQPLQAAVVKTVAAPVAYAAPIAKVHAPVAYAAPIAKVAAPVAYAHPAPLGYQAAAAYYH
ncbi:Cuticle Protein CPR RR-2 4 [Frankliniella occidentalis]|uniref:Cuticle protein 21-like isoform X1 n=1 Tax=Frankliniella occidentalis TaxID=133901 RepID=A0A6J1TP90_FRAOC|nr:cuticle protein 21-like isoform X1 [Frankliniella occidentalis]XP_052119673.1 cuticle protein 21-like isoform X2 [Frankliniella occidentalis]KAE8751105.1 Cuticle Protein CPR RR-2 4 [Frankliniella occidentalis]